MKPTMKNLLSILLVMLFVCDSAMGDGSPMEKEEVEALHAVIQGFVGKEWEGKELYPDPCGWTPIQGVSCDYFDGKWYITSLSFGPLLENSFECSHDAFFSPNIFQLNHLKSISIYKCFTIPIHNSTNIPPDGWENLAESLVTLEFRSNNGLVGEIPVGIGHLASLKSLVLVENGLGGELPSELGNLAHLQQLVLSGNNFSGPIPDSLGLNLSNLLILDISRNSLTGPLPSSLGGLSSLLKLDLSNNLIGGGLPREFLNLRNLTLLDVRNNNVSTMLLKSIQGMSSLEVMLLSNNPLNINIMGFNWANLVNLTTLDLSNTGLTGNIPESIGQLKSLRFLSLANNRLMGTVPSKLGQLPSVSALYMNGNNLSGLLGFSGEFYVRKGLRFAAWENPNLCYSVRLVGTGHVPDGVEQCRPEQEVGLSGLDLNKVGNAGDEHGSGAMVVSFNLRTFCCWFSWILISLLLECVEW